MNPTLVSVRSYRTHRPRREARPWQIIVAELAAAPGRSAAEPPPASRSGCSCTLCRSGISTR